jgi:proton-translocating NAD(P)+ transhydrogenase subunit alpha
MIVGVPTETYPGERRVALTPGVLAALDKVGLQALIEPGAGVSAGFPDAEYETKGAAIAKDRADVFARADIIAQVRGLGANPYEGTADLEHMKAGQILIGMQEPLTAKESITALATKGARVFALEMLPRITRAQSMDVLSSMATIAGYKAVLLAANALPRMFPMMMTAAGTITPARVFVVGAGVAGLQAIASAKRNGAQVRAYDVRPEVKEQIESLGARFEVLKLDNEETGDTGGYAKEMDEEFYRKQREMMSRVVAGSDVVITTAAIPGKKAPILVTKEMVSGMAPGSVVIDLAAERGGNCELTQADVEVNVDGVTILGPTNLPAGVPYHASQMFAKNTTTFILNLLSKEGELNINIEDEIISGTLVVQNGEVVHPRLREAFGMTERSDG